MASTGPSDDRGDRGVTGPERAYFAAVGLLAAWVGLPAYFAPSRVDKVLPFGVPPLHARVIGAIYISALAFLVGAMLARRWADIRVIPVILVIWTGGLGLVTVLHHDMFDFTKTQTQVWFGAYVAHPLIAVLLPGEHPRGRAPGKPRAPPPHCAP